MNFEKIICPLCQAGDSETVYSKDHAVLFGNDLRSCLLSQHICLHCGLIHTNPQPTSESLSEFYESYFMYGEQSDDPLRDRQLGFLVEHVPPRGKTLFDIGAHNGTFMDLAARAGFAVAGIEPSDPAREEAKSRFGIELIPGFFNESVMEEVGGPYDVVVLNHVLEHVKNPVDVLRLAGMATAPGGMVFVEVPDMENPQTDNIADFFTPEHTVYFTSGTMAQAAGRAGLVLQHLERDRQKHAFRALLRKAGPEDDLNEGVKGEYDGARAIMDGYIERKKRFMKEMTERLKGANRKIIVYGAGMHTAQLFRSGILDGFTVEAVVDSNAQRWGSRFDGFEVQSPDILADNQATVVISSYESQESIARYLEDFFPNVQQIKLYGS